MWKLVSAVVVVAMTLFSFAAFAAENVHRIAVHVDQNDPAVMNLALNNVQNLKKYYAGKGEKVIVQGRGDVQEEVSLSR